MDRDHDSLENALIGDSVIMLPKRLIKSATIVGATFDIDSDGCGDDDDFVIE